MKHSYEQEILLEDIENSYIKDSYITSIIDKFKINSILCNIEYDLTNPTILIGFPNPEISLRDFEITAFCTKDSIIEFNNELELLSLKLLKIFFKNSQQFQDIVELSLFEHIEYTYKTGN